MSQKTSERWVPEIVYEESGSKIPYIHVPDGEEDPGILFIFLSRQTGETEPGDDGDEVPIVEMDLHQYADMAALKARLPADVYDHVRRVLGLLPLKEAVKKGQEITFSVRESVAQITDTAARREEIRGEVERRLSEKTGRDS
jgi:hypothetical protein